MTETELALRRIYGSLERIVDDVERGNRDDELERAGSERDVVLDEGSRALKALDAFAQQFGVDVEVAP